MEIILASQSPRRKELLERMGIKDFETISPNVDESAFHGLPPEELVRRLNAGEIPHVRQAFLANAQSKVLLVEFDQEIAEKILDAAPKFGAAPHPVGSESKYEFAPMIYRVSGNPFINLEHLGHIFWSLF